MKNKYTKASNLVLNKIINKVTNNHKSQLVSVLTTIGCSTDQANTLLTKTSFVNVIKTVLRDNTSKLKK